MNRQATIAISLVLIALLAVIPAAAAVGSGPLAQPDEDTAQLNDSADENETKPGEQFAGVVGVQKAEIDGEVNARSFGLQVAQAASNESRADLVEERLEKNEARLEALETRQEQLREQREAGDLSEGQYRAQMAQIAVEIQSIERTTNESAAAAEGIPTELLAERGVDTERISTLRTQASELRGPEVREIARGIGGDRAGAPMGPPANASQAANGSDMPGGPGGNAGEETGPPSDRGQGQPDDRGENGTDNQPGNNAEDNRDESSENRNDGSSNSRAETGESNQSSEQDGRESNQSSEQNGRESNQSSARDDRKSIE